MTVDYVIKIGGSLLRDLELCAAFLARLDSISERCVFTVGSGPLGDAFNDLGFGRTIRLSPDRSSECWAAIQSVNARILCGLHGSFAPASTYAEVRAMLEYGQRPLIDAKDYVHQFSGLAYQTTDVRAAQIARDLNCTQLVVFTDVDGLYREDPRGNPGARKVRHIFANDPLLVERTSVDKGLATVLDAYGITAYVAGAAGYAESDKNLPQYLLAAASVIHPRP